jgi:UDPglucose--hexose-1-phosphate uridylyltransferase
MVSSCPFCAGNEAMTTPQIYAITDESGWRCRVVSNLYKALSIEGSNAIEHSGIFSSYGGFGVHEVIIDTPYHDLELHQWREQNFVDWLSTIKSRIVELQRDSRIKSLTLFKNSGIKAGASQPHPHTQLIALPIIPPSIYQKYKRFERHYQESGRVLIEDIIVQEYNDDRVVVENSDFVAFCPYASEYPFEMMIVAKEGLSRVEHIDKDELANLASILSISFKKLHSTIGEFDYNLFISMPPMEFGDEVGRLHIRITPRIYQYAGFEIDTNSAINPISPEDASSRLRESK